MKNFLKSIFAVLVLSSIFNSVAIWMGIFPNQPPYPVGCAINSVNPSKFGCKRDEFAICEYAYTKASRPTCYITDITEGERTFVEFPLGGVN